MERPKRKTRKAKEYLIIPFVVLSSLLILFDIGKNLTSEMDRIADQKALSANPAKPQVQPISTLSEEEMKQWTERLQKQSDT